MSVVSYPVFLLFHNLPNCFAYVKNGSLRSDGKALSVKLLSRDPVKEEFHARLSASPDIPVPWYQSDTDNQFCSCAKGLSSKSLGCFRLRSCSDQHKEVYVQVYGTFSFTHIFINKTFAELAGLQLKQELIMEPVDPVTCTSLSIVPSTQHDYEILDKASVHVENIFLQQIRVVFPGMQFPLWVSPNICASFRVAQILPHTEQAVLLVSSTELEVLPVSEEVIDARESRSVSSSLAKLDESLSNISRDAFVNSISSSLLLTGEVFRVLPHFLVENEKMLFHPSIIYVSDSSASNYVQYSIAEVKSPIRSSSPDFAVVVSIPAKTTFCRTSSLRTLRNILKSRPGHCVVSNRNYQAYSAISLTSLDGQSLGRCPVVVVCLSKDDFEWLSDARKQEELQDLLLELVSVYPVLLPYEGRSLTVTIAGRRLTVLLVPSVTKRRPKQCCFIADNNCEFKLKQDSSKMVLTHEELSDPDNYGLTAYGFPSKIECYNALIQDLISWVQYCWSHNNYGHSLLLGPEGSGRTSIATVLAGKLANSPRMGFCARVECSWWKGKKADVVEKNLSTLIQELTLRRPSLLILDDIDFVEISEEDEHRQIDVEKVFRMLSRLLSSCLFPVLVTARRLKSVHSSLVMPRGQRIFGIVTNVPALSEKDRVEVLNGLVEQKCNFMATSLTTENLSLTGMRQLATRIQIEAKIRAPYPPILKCDVDTALAISRPTASTILKTRDDVKITLEDVGGMKNEKRKLVEVLIWPAKYPEIFRAYDVEIGKGVLLHGPSGCGKTLLARAIANETKYNCIFVKGPELLSKYIGSSEENVRSVFERARASAPSIIIFDEIDSLAPQRGSDATGVTDRVVNQILTEMDGAECLQGVFVIGCSNRMDLIDPALLRPGRFDHLVECGPPNEEDRLDILNTILKSVKCSPKLSASRWVGKTNGWTGAELKALITNAQFDAMRKSPQSSSDAVILDDSNIEAVFQESLPKRISRTKKKFKAGGEVTYS